LNLGSKNSNKREVFRKKFVVKPFFVATNFTKLKIILFFNDQEKNLGQFSKKFVTKVLKIWHWDPGSGIRKKPIPDPGVKTALDLESGSATLVWKNLFCYYYFSPLNTFMKKGKDPRGPNTYGSRCGSGTLLKSQNFC
jgi:hypothetical protein